MWFWWVENDENGVEMHLWFLPQGLWTLLMNKYWLFIATCMIYNPTYLCFWSKRRQNKSYFVQIVGLVDRKYWGWSGNTYLIPTPRFINITDELIFTFYWYLHHLQHKIFVFLVKEALKSQICFKLWVWLAENGKVGVEIPLWFPPYRS